MQQYYRTDIEHVVADITICTQHHIPFLFAFNFELTAALFIKNPLNQKEVLFRTPLGTNSPKKRNIATKGIELQFKIEDKSVYAKKFNQVSEALHRGDTFLANLTVKTPIKTNKSLIEIYEGTNEDFCLYVPEKFVCYSPERFVYINKEGRINTHPMKGTISANIPNAAQTILNDEKESAEHATIVDLLRNDLSINAEKVKVERYRYITSISTQNDTILQVSSEISGQLPKNWESRTGQILFDMLPAGSICGAPKKATISLIKRAETEPRGFYTGVFGYYNGNDLDSAVLIRFIEKDNNGQLFYRSGGGITAKSNLENEYKEVMQKIYIPYDKPLFSDVICVRNGQLQRLDYHYRRMSNTCKTFYNKELSFECLSEGLASCSKEVLYKCRIVYGEKIESVTYTEYHPKQVNTVQFVYDDAIEYSYKYLDRSALTKLVENRGTDDIIIVKNGYITDSSFCNLIFEDAEGQKFTPKEALLKGTYREWLLKYGIVEEVSIRKEDVYRYKYVYFVNAMRGLDDCTKMEISKLRGYQ